MPALVGLIPCCIIVNVDIAIFSLVVINYNSLEVKLVQKTLACFLHLTQFEFPDQTVIHYSIIILYFFLCNPNLV